VNSTTIPSRFRARGRFNGPADPASLLEVENALAQTLPLQLKSLLAEADGFLLNDGVKLYSLAELLERNATLEIRKYIPGYLAIGDNSGSMAFVLSLAAQDLKVYCVGFGVMMEEYLRVVACDLHAWIQGELIDGDDETSEP
jgi:hypothetical protein